MALHGTNVLRITGLHGYGSNEIYAALSGAGVTEGRKESAKVVNALLRRVKAIGRPEIRVTEQVGRPYKDFPLEVVVEWIGPQPKEEK